jgi:methionine synthase I (cobalamin-dependent)
VDFLKALTSGRPLLMDGAMGTELLRIKAALPHCLAECNLTCPGAITAVHQAYCAAGAQVLLTNTFQANPLAMAPAEAEKICKAGVELARLAAGPGRFILGNVGPMLAGGPPREVFNPQALGQIMAALAGVDGIILETWSSPEALRVVQWIFHQADILDGLPLLLSLSYQRFTDGKLATQSGHEPETFARHAKRHGVAALGVNCGKDIGIEETVAILRRYRKMTDLPLFARPNAGSPTCKDGEWVYPLGPAQMAEGVPAMVNAEARMIGGCCGTTPAHLAAIGQKLTASSVIPPVRPASLPG